MRALRLDDRRGGDNREGLYWRFELWLRGEGVGVRFDHGGQRGDLRGEPVGLPRARRRPQPRHRAAVPPPPPGPAVRLRAGRRRARARPGDHRRRVAAQGPHALQAWWEILHGGMLDPRGQPPLYVVALLSHRGIRYASGPLHLVALASASLLAPRDRAVTEAPRAPARLRGARARRAAPARAPGRRRGLVLRRGHAPSPPGSCACSRTARSRTWAPAGTTRERSRLRGRQARARPRARSDVGGRRHRAARRRDRRRGEGWRTEAASSSARSGSGGTAVPFRDPQVPHARGPAARRSRRLPPVGVTTRASPASAPSCAAGRSTSSRSSGTCSAGT